MPKKPISFVKNNLMRFLAITFQLNLNDFNKEASLLYAFNHYNLLLTSADIIGCGFELVFIEAL